MIGDSVRLMRSAGRQVVYDAEHFFDTFRARIRRTRWPRCCAAQEAGASVLCLCDTNGGTMPEQIAEAVAAVQQRDVARWSASTRTTTPALAVANALAAVRAGADHAQGTINGVGERCGNMDLIPLDRQPAAQVQPRLPRSRHRCKHLTEVSRYVYETANMNLVTGQPYVGSSAFAHKGGMHVHAVQKDASTYEHVDRRRRSATRGRSSSASCPASATSPPRRARSSTSRTTRRRSSSVLERVQDLENAGYPVRGRRGELRAAAAQGDRPVQAVLRPRSLPRDRPDAGRAGEPISEATVKLHVGGARRAPRRRGRRPGQRARRRAPPGPAPLTTRRSSSVHLTDYKVRVINSKDETAASVRVVIECRRDTRRRHPRSLRHDRREREHHRRELAGAGRRVRVPPRSRRRAGPKRRSIPNRPAGAGGESMSEIHSAKAARVVAGMLADVVVGLVDGRRGGWRLGRRDPSTRIFPSSSA